MAQGFPEGETRDGIMVAGLMHYHVARKNQDKTQPKGGIMTWISLILGIFLAFFGILFIHYIWREQTPRKD